MEKSWSINRHGVHSDVPEEYSLVPVMHINSGQEVSQYDAPKFYSQTERGLLVNTSVLDREFRFSNPDIDYFSRNIREISHKVWLDLGRLHKIPITFSFNKQDGDFLSLIQLKDRLESGSLTAELLQALATYFLLKLNIEDISDSQKDFLSQLQQKANAVSLQVLDKIPNGSQWIQRGGGIRRKDKKFFSVTLENDEIGLRPKIKEVGKGLLMTPVLGVSHDNPAFFLQAKVEGGEAQLSTALQMSESNRLLHYEKLGDYSQWGKLFAHEQRENDFFFKDKINIHELLAISNKTKDQVEGLIKNGAWFTLRQIAAIFQSQPELISSHLLEGLGSYFIRFFR